MPSPRPRFRVLRKGSKFIVITYMLSSYMKWKLLLKQLLCGMSASKPDDTNGLTLVMAAYVKRPAKTARLYPKGDVDNYAKSVMDALNEFLYDDDDSVRTLIVTKEYRDADGLVIELRPWNVNRDSADALFAVRR